MALTSEISSLTEKYFYPALVDNIFTSNILLMRAKEKGWYERRQGAGESIRVPLAYATTTAAGWYDGSEALTTTANDQITSADFDYKQAHATIAITGKDEVLNSGKEAIVNFVKAKVQLAEKTLARNLGDGLYNVGTDTKQIIGLRLAVDSAGTTYGGISRTTYSWWSAQEDSTSTVLTLPLIQGLYGDCTVGNAKPTIITTTQNLWDIYWAKLQPQQRWQDTKTASAGFTNLLHNGTPIVIDGRCPDAFMFFLNEDYLHMIVPSERDFKWEPFVKPTNQDVSVAHVYWMGALCCSNCRLQGKLGAITA